MAEGDPEGPGTALVELRVLDGANLYFPRPAIKLTLAVPGLLSLPEERAAAVAGEVGLMAGSPGPPGGEQRRRFATRLLAHLVRRTAAAAGVRALAVRSRPGPEPAQLVVAYPWRRQHAAEALGRAVAELVASMGTPGLAERVEAAGAALRQVEAGPGPSLPVPRVPTVAVTGTNGKTTVTRLIAHMGRCGRAARRLVQHRRHLPGRRAGGGGRLVGPGRGGPGPGPARHPAGRAGDGQGRHPAPRGRGRPQRRRRGHQHLRRPPRPRRHPDPRPAGRGQGDDRADHPLRRLGGAERRRPADPGHAPAVAGPAVRLRPRPGRARPARGPDRGRAGRHRARRRPGRADQGPGRPAAAGPGRARHPGRPGLLQRGQRAGRGRRRRSPPACPGRRCSTACAASVPTRARTRAG